MPDDLNPTDPPAPDPNPEPPKQPVTFTQEQVDRIASKRASEGEKAAYQKLADELGKPVDEIKAIVKADEERREAAKSELDKLRETNEALERAKSDELGKARMEHHVDRVKLRLLKAGLPQETVDSDEALDDVVRLIRADVGSSAEDIDTSIGSLKERFPQLFAPSTSNGTPSSMPSGTPTRTPALGETAAERAARIAEANNKARGVTSPTA